MKLTWPTVIAFAIAQFVSISAALRGNWPVAFIAAAVALAIVIVRAVRAAHRGDWGPPEYPSQLRHRQLEHITRTDRIR